MFIGQFLILCLLQDTQKRVFLNRSRNLNDVLPIGNLSKDQMEQLRSHLGIKPLFSRVEMTFVADFVEGRISEDLIFECRILERHDRTAVSWNTCSFAIL